MRIRIARVITEVFAPGVLVAVLLMVVGFHAGDQPGVSRWWGAPAAVFAAGIPMAYIVRGVRRGQLTNHHIPEREHRRGPLIFGAVSVAIGTAALVLLGAPRELLALLAAGITGLIVFGAVTAFWKMSIHSGVAAGTAAVLIAVYGPIALLAVPLVPLIGWSRLVLAAHTFAQVVAGTLVGALIAGTVFPVLR
ncbi:phosphatase PAP2 family protein [Paractinoplanes lichenicola]|uniref:phosphatase PAP2 family protein n=1 Tax=Paractinoplanes lichenicola TaxID=2802976 RepID=UPI001F3417CB|nr:phosphatase PAP2 family protein [Actinoplanes lichenicola]